MADDEWVIVSHDANKSSVQMSLPIRSSNAQRAVEFDSDVNMSESELELALDDNGDHDESNDDDENEDEGTDMFDMFTGQVVEEKNEVELFETPAYDELLPFQMNPNYSIINNVVTKPTKRVTSKSITPPEAPPDIRALNAQAHQPFVYNSVTDPSHIRVLEILPAETPDEGLQLSIRTTLPTRAHYLAVSYTWGQSVSDGSHLTKTVPCDGRLLRITARLHSVLLAVRRHLDAGHWTMFGRRPYVWVDAICINQDSWDERSLQVQLLGKIYTKAAAMVMWLGEADHNYDERMRQAAAILLSQKDNAPYDTVKSGPLPFTQEDTMRLLNRDWFKRRWIIQEFAVHNTRTILLGKVAVGFPAFFLLLQHYNLVQEAGPIRDVALFDSFRPRRWLLTNLHRYREAQCDLLHDIVYSLVHISCGCQWARAASQCGANDCGGSSYNIDYSLKFDDLLLKLTLQFLRSQFIAVLACACIRLSPGQGLSGTRRLPSWVPDWTIQPRNGSPQLLQYVDNCFESWISDKAGEAFSLPRDAEGWESKSKALDYIEIPHDIDRTITMCGWILERPSSGTSVSDLDWSKVGCAKPDMQSFRKDYNVDLEGPWTDRPKSSRHRYELQDSQGPPYEIISGNWPKLKPDDMVCFLYGYQLTFILRKSESGTFKLVECVRRSQHMIKTSFIWTQKETGEIWAYGHVRRPPLKFRLG